VATLTINTTNVTPPDSYLLQITGTNSLLSDEEEVELDVTNAIDSDLDGLPDWWMQQTFGHPTGLSADHSRAQDDFDGDGMSNFAEYLCQTDPTDSTSYLHLVSVQPQGSDDWITWAAEGGVNYVVQASTDLGAGFSDVSPVIVPDGDGDTEATWVDAGAATNAAPRFYRVRLAP